MPQSILEHVPATRRGAQQDAVAEVETQGKLRGKLYVVGTPIGNLGDMTFRGVDTLKAVDLIAAEDTRHTGRLLHHFQITTPQISYHAHNWRSRLPQLLAHLQEGKDLALVSDAGMPGISDPGFELIEACVQQSVPVVPIPGGTAAVTALCVSGLSPQPFVFEGFLPPKGRSRREMLQRLGEEPRTVVLYEAPHRLLQTLADLQTHCEATRPVAIARELTKQYEEIWRGSLAEGIAYFQTHAPRGEFTLVLAGKPAIAASPIADETIFARLSTLIQEGLSQSQASRQIAQETGRSRREIYQLALALLPPQDPDEFPEEDPAATKNSQDSDGTLGA